MGNPQEKSLIGILAMFGEIAVVGGSTVRRAFYRNRESVDESYDAQQDPGEFLCMEDLTEAVHNNIRDSLSRPGVDGLVVFECQDMCSSQFGARKGLFFGPSCTYKTADEVIWQDKDKKVLNRLDAELASTQKQPVAYFIKKD